MKKTENEVVAEIHHVSMCKAICTQYGKCENIIKHKKTNEERLVAECVWEGDVTKYLKK